MQIIVSQDEYLIYGFQAEGCHVIPPHYQPQNFCGDSILWLLSIEETENSKMFKCGQYEVKTNESNVLICFDGEYQEKEFTNRPCCDFFGNMFSFDMAHKDLFEKTFSRFYWDNLLNQIAERTFMGEKEDIREGYVLSTLNKNAYPGTYPAVDHEFHMKGRFAVGGKVESDLIRRMLLLQMKIMREDEMQLSRNVCSVQPDGMREYDVWRKCESHQCEAQMFRLTGNIEFVEAFYNYYALTKDIDFVKENIDALEKNCKYIERFIREDGLLDSHVYYEDQVIKDGPVLQAQLFAVNSFRLMSEIEELLDRKQKSSYYSTLARKLGEAAVRTYPQGFWDDKENCFIDWIDSKGDKHDHIHLLSNELPILFGLADEIQSEKCCELIDMHKDVFEKFPSFVAAKIEDYTADEIGTGGPYDLCAAGRYWCWDAEYYAYKKDGNKILNQLLQVCEQAELDNFLMGERYDMNYVYYNTGQYAQHNWHGASDYYEYPNVWIYVMICKYIGVRAGINDDLIIDPLFENGSITLEQYGVSFVVENFKTSQIRNIGKKTLQIYLPEFGKRVVLKSGECVQNKETKEKM